MTDEQRVPLRGQAAYQKHSSHSLTDLDLNTGLISTVLPRERQGAYHFSNRPCLRDPRCFLTMSNRLAKGKLRCEGLQEAAAGNNKYQCILQLQHLVFFSYSWPWLRVLWPTAISQDLVAKTVHVHCSEFQCGSRPVFYSALCMVLRSA